MARKPSPWRDQGSVLLLGLVVSVVIALTMAAAVSTTFMMGKDAQHEMDRTRALAVAEGVTELVQQQLLSEISNFQTPTVSGSMALGGASHPYTVSTIGAPFSQTDADGVTSSLQHYLISASATEGQSSVTVERVVDLTMTPLFQFMIFYSDDLEILPGPNMTLGGRVHANGDLYAGCGGTLRVDTEYFHATGHILRRRKNDGSETSGTVQIKVAGESSYVDLEPAYDSEYNDWTAYALDTWKGTVQDGAHGVKAVKAPDIGSIKAFNNDGTKGYYHAQAGLVVVDGAAYDSSGNPVALPPGTITEKTMYDGREGRPITVTEIDVQLLNSSGQFPANGLLYAYRTDASLSQPGGIRLAAGEELAAPLTVVSEDPVYVKGDFNTRNKKGAAVIADAVNLLSNAWNDSKSAGTLPAATPTTYNLAFITGNVPTPDGGGNYSGGFENLPRFHERWTGVTATIRGAFVNIFESEVARSPWRYGGDVYTAPIRDWAFDPDLNDLTNLPPFTPNAVYFQRVLWDDKVPLPFVP